MIVCLRSVNQERAFGISHERRELETEEAMLYLGCPWEQWEFPNDNPDWEGVADRMLTYQSTATEVWAPYHFEEDAHEQHRKIGLLARGIFGDCVTHYLTYSEKPPYTRTKGELVPIHNPFWVKQKFLALSAYQSQLFAPEGYHHFINDQREYYWAE